MENSLAVIFTEGIPAVFGSNGRLHTLRFLNRALWYIYVMRTNKMHTFSLLL